MLIGCAPVVQRGLPPLGPVSALAPSARPAGGRIVLRVFDDAGKRVGWSAFRAIEEDGQFADDALLDAATMDVTAIGPLSSSNGKADGDPSLVPVGRGAALSLAWPSSSGYSNLVFRLPERAGTYDFNDLAARQVLEDIRTSLAARSWYRPDARFDALYAKAKRDFARGRAARSLDAGTAAEMDLLAASGVAWASAHPGTQDWAGTFDTITGGVPGLKVLASLYPKDGWLRICFDPGEKPAYYAAEIAHAHALGLKVVGQILDSSEMRRWSVAAFERRTREYVGALSDVDEWETGNEINGNWLGTTASVVEKTRYASEYVKTHTRARVLVTLFWELGEGSVANATFTWAHAHMGSIAPYVDDVGLSLYPHQDPMGEPFDRVVAALHAAFPAQRVAITELGYIQKKGWWWGSRDSVPAGRDAVAALYQSAIMGYPYSGGGTFWWYFVEQVTRGNALYKTMESVYRSAH